MPKVLLFLVTGFEEIEAITAIDVLRRAEIDLCTVSLTDTLNVVGAHGVSIEADELFGAADFGSADMLVLPGGPGTSNYLEHKGFIEIIIEFNSKGKYIGAICAAPMVLGLNGLLKNRKATCYPGMEEHLVGANLAADKVIVDSNIITSKGPGTSFDFAFKIVEVLTNKRTADDLRKGMIVTGR